MLCFSSRAWPACWGSYLWNFWWLELCKMILVSLVELCCSVWSRGINCARCFFFARIKSTLCLSFTRMPKNSSCFFSNKFACLFEGNHLLQRLLFYFRPCLSQAWGWASAFGPLDNTMWRWWLRQEFNSSSITDGWDKSLTCLLLPSQWAVVGNLLP